MTFWWLLMRSCMEEKKHLLMFRVLLKKLLLGLRLPSLIVEWIVD